MEGSCIQFPDNFLLLSTLCSHHFPSPISSLFSGVITVNSVNSYQWCFHWEEMQPDLRRHGIRNAIKATERSKHLCLEKVQLQCAKIRNSILAEVQSLQTNAKNQFWHKCSLARLLLITEWCNYRYKSKRASHCSSTGWHRPQQPNSTQAPNGRSQCYCDQSIFFSWACSRSTNESKSEWEFICSTSDWDWQLCRVRNSSIYPCGKSLVWYDETRGAVKISSNTLCWTTRLSLRPYQLRWLDYPRISWQVVL